MGTGFIPLPDLAKDAGVTLNQVRHWISALGVEVVMVGRVRHVNQDGAGRLKEMAGLVAAGKTPKEAAGLVAGKPEQAQVVPEPTTALAVQQNSDVVPRLVGIEKALLAVVEELKATRQEVVTLRTENQVLRSEVTGVRLALLPPMEPSRQVIPWQPEDRPDPSRGQPWYRVLWWELTAPERLRRADS